MLIKIDGAYYEADDIVYVEESKETGPRKARMRMRDGTEVTRLKYGEHTSFDQLINLINAAKGRVKLAPER